LGERYLIGTAAFVFQEDRRAGTMSLRVNPNALNFPFISSKTALPIGVVETPLCNDHDPLPIFKRTRRRPLPVSDVLDFPA
jgi:hypothetical protein